MMKKVILCAIFILSLIIPAMAQDAKTPKRALTPEELRQLLPALNQEPSNQYPGGTWNNGTVNQNYQAPYYYYNQNPTNQNRATYLPQYGPQLNDRYRQTAPSTDYTRNPYLNGPYINGPIVHGQYLNLPNNNNQTMNSSCPNCGVPLNTNSGTYNGGYPNYGDYRPQNNGGYPNYGDYRYRGNPYGR